MSAYVRASLGFRPARVWRPLAQPVSAREGNQDLRIIFFAIPSATARSEAANAGEERVRSGLAAQSRQGVSARRAWDPVTVHCASASGPIPRMKAEEKGSDVKSGLPTSTRRLLKCL